MPLPIAPPFAPMEALSAEDLPAGSEWIYEPKWDGFRCLAFRDGDDVQLQSKSGQPLARYFPDLVEVLRGVPAPRFVLDGEIVVPVGDALSFDELQLRLHPAASRVRMLAARHPAHFVVFDLLVDADGRLLAERPQVERRAALEAFAARVFAGQERLRLSPSTDDLDTARGWLRGTGALLDGVVAKRRSLPYASGERAMRKIKRLRTADCVVGGFRYGAGGRAVGSLLLGLYNHEGLLDHVGFTSGLDAARRKALTPVLEKLSGPPGFTGRAPGGPSRWNQGQPAEWEPVRHELVVEVQYDHVTGGRFRHGTRLLRLRPDKAPRQCTLEQLES